MEEFHLEVVTLKLRNVMSVHVKMGGCYVENVTTTVMGKTLENAENVKGWDIEINVYLNYILQP
jgi:hypothetical protein